ncbi:MAG: hypothetical protein J1F35_00740 [Erysipelotrichales bacterium]|nr:hypothetical protein [Erysipelotrichales bacterium]
MEKAKLIIKYDNKYIIDKIHNELNFINVPLYNSNSDFSNIDIFITLLCFGYMNNNHGATKGFNYCDGLKIFEHFNPENIREIDKNTFFYDLDKLLNYDTELKIVCERNLKNLPGSLESYEYDEILSIACNNNYNVSESSDDSIPHVFDFSISRVDMSLLESLKLLNIKRTDKDVLLLYSGGKDSTLSAVRLRNEGYNIYFIHFDNGAMRDADKPYLTFKNSFGLKDGYYFDYRFHSCDVSKTFDYLFEKWKKENGDTLEHGTMTSEIRCLSCRMAMYVEALSIAKAYGFKYIAEGARISQKFMLEQEQMTNRLKELAAIYGIELIFPVLTLEDNFAEKNELIANGFSSKGWESKCLLGREAMDKKPEDEKIILDYYDNILKPKVLGLVNNERFKD